MAEYIDKRDAIDIFKQFKRRKWISMPIEQVIEIISVVPYVEVEPVKHGRWFKTGQSLVYPDKFRNYFCSECGFELDAHIRQEPNFCPNCGAIMDEVEE